MSVMPKDIGWAISPFIVVMMVIVFTKFTLVLFLIYLALALYQDDWNIVKWTWEDEEKTDANAFPRR